METSIKETPAAFAAPEIAPTVASLKAEVKTLQNSKGAIARQFKNPELDDQQREELKRSMQHVSAALNAAQAELKRQLKQDAPKNSKPKAQQPLLPPQFRTSPRQLGAPVDVRELASGEQSAWQRFAAQHPQASAYHTPIYLSLIKQYFGHDSLVLGAFHNGELVGALPLVLMRSKLFGEFGVSLPYFNYGGPLSEFEDVKIALLEKASTLLEPLSLGHMEVRTTHPGLPFPAVQKKVSMVLTLPPDAETLDRQLGAKVRAQFNKTRHYDPEIRFGKTELLDDFYHVFATNMRDLGTPIYSKDWFRGLLTEETIQATLAVAYLDGKPVGTGFLLGHGDMLEIPWASSLRKVNDTNVNMWLYREILGFAIAQNYRYFDFGRSTKDGGTYRFKKQWGAKPIQHYWYYIASSGSKIRSTDPDSPKYRLLIAVWQRMPVWLTRIIGPRVIKNIP